MLDRVPKQVLERLLEPALVGLRGPESVLDDEHRVVAGVDRLPRPLGDVLDGDRARLTDFAALSGQREHVVEDRVHSGDAVERAVEVGHVVFLAGEFDEPLGDVEGVPQVV